MLVEEIVVQVPKAANRDGTIPVKRITTTRENDIVVSEVVHRHVLEPGDDLAGEDEGIVSLARATWTAEIVASYRADKARFQRSIPAVRRMVPKSVIIDRLHSAGKLAAASEALNADVYARERWYAPDKPAVSADDRETIALFKAIGADPNAILAP